MSLLRRMERVERMHDLIQYKRTGPPDRFARKLGLSQSMLYLLLKELKAMGAPIIYCKYRESYKYQYPVAFKFGFESLSADEIQKVSGGGRQYLSLFSSLPDKKVRRKKKGLD
ncbi:MAG: hypothetical protein AAGI23_16075 [Bacteroidota bacterium]